MSDGGKGSKPRPFSVDRKTFEDNWDRIFSSKSKAVQKEEQQDASTVEQDKR